MFGDCAAFCCRLQWAVSLADKAAARHARCITAVGDKTSRNAYVPDTFSTETQGWHFSLSTLFEALIADISLAAGT